MESTNGSGSSVIVSQQPAQETLAADASKVRRHPGQRVVGRSGRSLRDRAIPETLMWAMDVVKVDVLLSDVIKMPQPEGKEMVQTFSFDRTDPGFCIGIGIRR